MPKLKPHSKPSAYAKIDRRTWQGRLLEETRLDLTRQVGGNPTSVQRALIDRAAMLTLHVTQLDRRTVQGKAMTEYDSRTYLAWSNSLARTLDKIGLRAAPEPGLALRAHLAGRSAPTHP